MTRRVRNTAVLVLAIGFLVVGAVLLWLWNRLNTPALPTGEVVTVELARGLHAGAMFSRLHDAGVLESPGLLRMWVALRGGGEHLHAGEYRFDEPLTPLQVLAKLERGDVALHAVTLPEGLDLNESAVRVAEAGFGDIEAVLEAFRDPLPIAEIDPDAVDLEGYLFPETYQFPKSTPPAIIAETMVNRFVESTGGDYAARARAVGLTLREAVTLASMIEKETAVAEER
ncbi:MAG: endolytic transglycosylase MltG, partial [Acidobacteriota bacterium]|nr:endolytic transglycosylase MltG [Acidobacteriota bacterium]